jgi:hypothetical protein
MVPTFEIRTLGTASGLPTAQRFGQTIVLTQHTDAGSSHCLLDTGDGASSLLMHHGYDHRRIHSIIISHMHADHHGGLAQVIKTCMHVEKRDELVVLAPAEGIAAFQAYLDASYLFAEWIGFPIRWVPLPTVVDSPFAMPGGGVLRAYPNAHMAWVRDRMDSVARLRDIPAAPESYSVSYEHAGRRIVYAGNLNGPNGSDELASFAEPCDMLIAELAHVHPAALGRFLTGRDIRATVVVHFHPQWDQLSDAAIHEQISSGVGAGGLRGSVLLARDGDRFPLPSGQLPSL